jgi:SRSO17 transposase
MVRRFEVRLDELMAACKVEPAMFDGLARRLEEFVEPFAQAVFRRRESKQHAQTYVAGLLSDLRRKNTESIAYRHDQDRQGLQRFIGFHQWDHHRLVTELVRQVGTRLGQADGVIVFDPSGFAKKGDASVGVKRQWLGRLGKVDNGQVGVYMGYVSRVDHALLDVRLYLPREWARDKPRRKKCGVPKEVRFQTRHQLAMEMLAEHRQSVPHAWVAGDDEMGRSTRFRRDLDELGEQYLLAVPSNTTVRDLEEKMPQASGRGRQRKAPFRQVRKWLDAFAQAAWSRIIVRDTEKGPLEVEILKRRVQARTEQRKVGPEEILIVIRWREESGAVKHDYYLSNAPPKTSLKEFARVAKAEHRIEECIQRAKSEAGLADYEVRNWSGWHHHQVLSLIATWFLVLETLRGKKPDARHHRASNTRRLSHAPSRGLSMCDTRTTGPGQTAPNRTERTGQILSLQKT